MTIEHELYLHLVNQAYGIATYLISNGLAPDSCTAIDDDRDALERAADHVTVLAGYQGAAANDVSDAIWRGLRVKMRQPQRYQFSITE